MVWGHVLGYGRAMPHPWVRFTCTFVQGRQRDLQGLPVFGQKALVAEVGCMSRRQGGDLRVKSLCLESPP